MRINFYGHACLKIRSAPGRPACLMDPWFSRDGAFFSSWFQFPENHPLRGEALDSVSAIFVSHNHADHFDVETLRLAMDADPGLTLHIPRYATPWFRKKADAKLPRFGHRILEHAPFEPARLPDGGEVFFVPEESPAQFDSAMVYRNGDLALVNLNDSRLSGQQLLDIKKRLPRIDFLTIQASGASEFPVNYSYSPSEMRRHSLEKRASKWDLCEKTFDLLKPERVLFFAGPPVFLAPELRRFNEKSELSVFPDQREILTHFAGARPDIAEKSLFLLPGEPFDDRHLWPSARKELESGAERFLPYVQKERYLDRYAETRADLLVLDKGGLPSDEALLGHFGRMPKLSDPLSAGISGKIGFVVQGNEGSRTITVDFASKDVRFGEAPDALYVLTVPAAHLRAVLDGEATWDDVFLSLRARFDEGTDRFVPHLKTLLRYMDAEVFSKLEEYRKSVTPETPDIPMMNVDLKGKTIRVQRLCPHGGTDLLTNGRVNPDGTITCLTHRFCFDLATGDCLNAAGFKLKVRK